ncbi:MAG TPA: TRAP transporter substrate-binding protein [Clostridia bacterium]|nr:TRAP transporter substrate-binding protein [Clostridia bacterium]
MKKLTAIILAALVLLSVAGCNSASSSAPQATTSTSGGASSASEGYDKVKLKMSFSGTDAGIDGLVAAKMKEMLAEKSGGAVTLETFGNAQLASGNMQRQVELLIAGGSFELGIIAETVMADVDKSLYVTNIPFSFASYEEAYKMADSTGGEWSKKKLAEHGIVRIDCFSNGIMHLTNNKRAIKTPADLAGLKMRTYGDVQMSLMKELGADPINMNWSEVYSAMQMGTIDGHMNGYQTIDSASIFEVQPYLTEASVIWSAYDIVASQKSWDKLSPKTQELIMSVSREAALWGREYMSEKEATIKEKFTTAGVTITTLTQAELDAFKQAASQTRKSFMEQCGEEACTAWGI